MTALTQPRNTPAWGDSPHRVGDAAASVLIYAGAIVMRDASGNLTKGATATDLIGVGRASSTVDNSGGSAADETVAFEQGTFRFANSASGDAITKADIGNIAFAVDDQTVAKTDGTGTRSPVGIIAGVDDLGVWVQFDEALTKTRAVADEALATASA